MKFFLIFTLLFLAIMIVKHAWDEKQKSGSWPWKSSSFWRVERQISTFATILFALIFIVVGRLDNGHWFWVTHDYHSCDWGMTPSQVIKTEDYTGRPSGSQDPPKVVNIGNNLRYMHVEGFYFVPILTQAHPLSYIFKDNELIAAYTTVYTNTLNDEIWKDIVAKETSKRIFVVYKANDDSSYVWLDNDRSYYGLSRSPSYSHIKKMNISKQVDKKDINSLLVSIYDRN
jgi:hypothetical protein